MAGLGYETESSGGAQPVNGLLALPDCVLITIITLATGRWESLWGGRVGDGLSRRAEGVPSAWITGKAHVLAYVNIPQASTVGYSGSGMVRRLRIINGAMCLSIGRKSFTLGYVLSFASTCRCSSDFTA